MRYPLSRNKSFAERLIHEITSTLEKISQICEQAHILFPQFHLVGALLPHFTLRV